MMKAPSTAAARSGTMEKAKIPSKASRSSLMGPYFGSPACRSARSTSIPICRNPTHERSPRTNRSRSGVALSASTTRRLMSEKSPASSGTLTDESDAMSR